MLLALWILTAFGIALWSLCAWGLHTLLTIDPAWLNDVNTAVAHLPWGDWLATWLPGWQGLLRVGIDLTQAGLAWVGSAAPWIVWAVWGLGSLAMLAVAGLLGLLLKLALPKAAPPPARAA